MVIKISDNSTKTIKISSDDKLKCAKIDENGCSFIYEGKLDLIINLEKLDDKILSSEKHCDVILMRDDEVFFIELKNTENTIEKEKIEKTMGALPKKFQGTLQAFNCIKKLFKINSNKYIEINYIFYIHKKTFEELKTLKSLMVKLKQNLINVAYKDLCSAIIKTCGENIYSSNYDTTIKLINRKKNK